MTRLALTDLLEAMTAPSFQEVVVHTLDNATSFDPQDILFTVEGLAGDDDLSGAETREMLPALMKVLIYGVAALEEGVFPACPACRCDNILWKKDCTCARRDCGCYMERTGDQSLLQ